MNLLEAFVKLDEDAFDTTPKGIEDLSDFMDDADVVDDEIEIIDPDIDFGDDDTMPEDEEHEEENAHVGQLVLQCNTCNALVYKDKDEVELDEEGNVVEEECPNCHNESKFDVIGKICEVEDIEDELEDEDEEESEEEESKEEPEKEEEKSIKEESLRRPNKKSLKENRKQLNEGPGAGYTISGDLDNINVNSFDFKVDGDIVIVNCDIDAELENVEAYSYYYGDEVGYEVPVKITEVNYFWESDTDEVLDENAVEEDLEYNLSHLQFKALVGGGWVHATFDGNLEVEDIRHWNGEDSPITRLVMHCTDEEDIQFIDDLVTGNFENDEEEFDESLKKSRKRKSCNEEKSVDKDHILALHRKYQKEAKDKKLFGIIYGYRVGGKFHKITPIECKTSKEMMLKGDAIQKSMKGAVAQAAYSQTDKNESLRRPRKLKEAKQRLNETLMDAVLDRIDGVPYNPREFYHYVNAWNVDWYNDVAHEMDEGEEEDVANAIIRGLQNSIRGDGGDPYNPSAKQLYKFVKDSTWLTNDRTGDVPEYIKNIHNELYSESLEKSLRRNRKVRKESLRRPRKKALKENEDDRQFISRDEYIRDTGREPGMKDYMSLMGYDFYDAQDAVIDDYMSQYDDWDDDLDESCGKKKKSKKLAKESLKKPAKDKILKDINKLKNESLKEELEGIRVDTDEEIIQITQKEDGGVAVETSPKDSEEPMFEEPPMMGAEDEEEVIMPLTDEEEEEIAEENPESEDEEMPEEEEEEEEIDDIDTDSFDELGESYLKEAYENVKSFKTSKVFKKDGKLVVEGILSFKSGKNKKTSFIFESAHNKSKKKVLLGENKQITPNSKSFRLRGVVKNKKMVCESLRYNYKEGKNRVSGVCRVK